MTRHIDVIICNLDLQFLARALGGEVEGNQIRAPGPGHSAKDRSLTVKLDASAPDGFVVHSFAGDDAILSKDYVREKAGLSAFKPQRRRRASTDTINAMLAGAMQSLKTEAPTGRIVAAYDYADDKGELLYQVVRLEPKDFRQRRPDGKGGWTWSAGERRVLYRLPELVQFPDASVFVTEGEKDADRVASLGYCATTVACGKWTDDCVKALAGRDVVILEDNDDAGREKAIKAANALHATAKTVRVIRLPDLPEKGDVSDWLDADPSHGGKLAEVCFDMPVWTPDAATTKDEAPTEPPPLDFIDLTAWEGQPIPERQWAVLDRVPDGEVTLLSGEGAVGKSLILKQLAVATVTADLAVERAIRHRTDLSKDFDQTEAAPRKFKLGPLGNLNQVTKGLAKTRSPSMWPAILKTPAARLKTSSGSCARSSSGLAPIRCPPMKSQRQKSQR